MIADVHLSISNGLLVSLVKVLLHLIFLCLSPCLSNILSFTLSTVNGIHTVIEFNHVIHWDSARLVEKDVEADCKAREIGRSRLER